MDVAGELADDFTEWPGKGKEPEKLQCNKYLCSKPKAKYYLHRQTKENEKNVGRGKTSKKGIRGRLERALPHDSKDDKKVARHSQTEDEAALEYV